MYTAHFGLKERPFSISPDPRFLFLTAQHQEALAKCQYAIAERMGISAIYGDIGAGKTSLARRLWEQYAADPACRFAMLVHPNYPSPFQLLSTIMAEFGLARQGRSLADKLAAFQEFLIEEHAQGHTVILVLDEAQNLKPPLLELLRELLNFETNRAKLLQIVLFGQNELMARLERVPELKDRITLFGALSSLTYDDVQALIDYRWRVAGGREHPFSSEALRTIFAATRGLPRQVCKLCDNALIRAYSQELSTIDTPTIAQVAQEIHLAEPEAPRLPQLGRRRKYGHKNAPRYFRQAHVTRR
jgi:general secretion pathway protein A